MHHELSFKNWIAKQESTAFTRRRHAALLGLAPEIPDGEIHRHSTFPFEKELKDKKRKKKRKKKEESLDEGRRSKAIPNRKVDDWLKEIEGLRPDLDALKSVIDKKRKKTLKGKSIAKEGEDDVDATDTKDEKPENRDSADSGREDTPDTERNGRSDEEE